MVSLSRSGVNHLGLSCCFSVLAALGGDQAPEPGALDAREAPSGLAAPRGQLDPAVLGATIAGIVREARLPGAAVAVVDGTRTWTAAFGQADLGGARMTVDSLFRVGSLTKTFVTLAIMRLAESGRLSLSDRVRDLVPEIAVQNPWERTDPLRVAHLLEHTSGFDEMRFNEIFDTPAGQARPLRQVLAVNPRSRVVRWRPGSRFSYSQPGYTLAGYIVEKVSGMPYERFLEQEVLGPMGVQGAALRLTPEVRGRLATGHHGRRPVEQVLLMQRPAGNLMISAAGLARLIELQLGRGEVAGRRFLQAASILRMERCETMPTAAAPACYGKGSWGDVSTPLPTRAHGGYMPGYLSFYRYSPELGFGYAVLVNDTNGRASRAINKAILKHLLAGFRAPPPPTLPAPLPGLDRYAGYYRLVSPEVEFLRFQSDVYEGITVAVEGPHIFLVAPDGERVPLVATGQDLFRFPGDSDSSIRFARSAEGERLLVVHNTTFQQENALWAAARRWALELALGLLSSAGLVPFILFLSRERARAALLVRPFVAAACLLAMATAFEHAHDANLLGVPSLPTLIVWICSWVFALAAHTGFHRTIRRLRDPETSLFIRGYALLLSGAAVWVALHLSRYGLIGLRTWRW
jgi:CubicO group peptidase (beta-lactamase class C family)